MIFQARFHQVLGYFAWKKQPDIEVIMDDYRSYLEEYVYEKIWSELSVQDKKICHAIASTESAKIADIREFLNIDTNHFNPYRKRLLRKGLVDGERGYLRFTLPLFEDFVLANFME